MDKSISTIDFSINQKNTFCTISTMYSGMFVACVIFVYMLSYRPFIFEAYMPSHIRIGIEGFTLFLLLIVNVKYKYFKGFIWYLPFVIISCCAVLLGQDEFIKIVFSLNKYLFFILAVGLFCGNRRILNTYSKLWIKSWSLLAIMAILAFVGHLTRIVHFSPMDFYEHLGLGSGGTRYYLHNSLLGNLVPKRIFGIEFGRVAGFMFEPGLLAFFFGFNCLVAEDWIEDQRCAKRFLWLNVTAGLMTISFSFIFFMSIYLIGKQLIGIAKGKVYMILLIPVSLLIFYYVYSVNILDQTSSFARIKIMYMVMMILQDNSWLTWLFGNGVGASVVLYGSGIDSGWLRILVGRGIIMLIYNVCLFVKHTKFNPWLTLYIVFYNFAINSFWDPVFLVIIAMYYAAHCHIVHNSMCATDYVLVEV